MARDYKSEHRGGMHEDSALGPTVECPNCDPWHEDYIPSEAPKKEIKDGWTDAWVEAQQQNKHYGN